MVTPTNELPWNLIMIDKFFVNKMTTKNSSFHCYTVVKQTKTNWYSINTKKLYRNNDDTIWQVCNTTIDIL